MEDFESLLSKNKKFDDLYELTPFDLEKVNMIIGRINDSRTKNNPIPGDVIQCIGPNKQYLFGHMEQDLSTVFGQICTTASIPFVTLIEGTSDVSFTTSGGYWISCNDIDKFEYVGKSLKKFCTWGHNGMCAAGVVLFEVNVNVWKLTLNKIY